MLCALGSVVFATATASIDAGLGRATSWIALGAGFGLTIWLGSDRTIDASWIGGIVVLVAAWQLGRPGRALAMIGAAGALAGLWALLLQAIGLPGFLAVPGAAFAPIVSAYLSMRISRFAPDLLREEAMLAVLILALVVGMAPTVSQGWQSALALNMTEKGGASTPVPLWMLSLVGASMTLGGLYSLWRRG